MEPYLMNPSPTENKPEQKIEQAQPVVQTNEPSPEIKSEENKANWKHFREQRENERKAREYAEKAAAEERARAEALKAALEAVTNKPNNQYNAPQYADDIAETEEQRIDRRVEAAIKQREAEAERKRLERERQETPEKLQSTYKDFNKVCTAENLDYLEYHYPEVAKPFAYMPEGFDKWASIYQAVKRFVPTTDAKHDIAKAEKNLQKPGSISSAGNTQGGNAMPGARLDEQKKAENWQRMQRLLKGLS